LDRTRGEQLKILKENNFFIRIWNFEFRLGYT